MDSSPANEGAFPDENPNRPREYHGRRTLVVGLLVIGAAALALWLALSGDSPNTAGAVGPVDLPSYLNPDQQRVAVSAGALAPDFELETLSGGRFRLSDWRGHPVLLNFWASWCGPCRREVPVLVRLQDQHREAGLVIVGVNIEEARRPAAGFRDEFSMNFTLPMDFGGGVTRQYNVVGPPNSIFIGPDGVIDTIFIGQAPDDLFEREVAALLGTLDGPVGPVLLAGPKALPARFTADDAALSATVGALTPDFVAQRWDRGGPWRLSDNLATPVLLILSPPGCVACAAESAAAAEVARAAGYLAVVLSGSAGQAPGGAVALEWRDDIGALFGATADFRAVVIDSAAEVRSVVNAAAELPLTLPPLGGEQAAP